MSKWQWILKQFGKRLWVRASLFCLLAFITALAGIVARDYIPESVSRKVGAQAVDNILQIIANSMLAVTTFSLSIMVAAYSAATNNVTPRSTQLLLQDSTAQNALSVFIGAFLYSLVGIVALSMHVYGESGRLVLFVVTIGVIFLIIAVMLRWISHLSRLGRVGETISMVEKATLNSLKARIEQPYLGGSPLLKFEKNKNHHPVRCGVIGYIQHVDMGALSELAETIGAEFYFCMIPGSFNDAVSPLFYSSVPLDETSLPAACDAYSIAETRSFEQDPRFGLLVLGEIASRALSPAVNDPGTAIDIIGSSLRIMSVWVTRDAADPPPRFPHLHVPPLATKDMLEDVYLGVARDGAGMLQVGIRLHKALIALRRKGSDETKEAVSEISAYALAYAQKRLALDSEKQRIAALAETGD